MEKIKVGDAPFRRNLKGWRLGLLASVAAAAMMAPTAWAADAADQQTTASDQAAEQGDAAESYNMLEEILVTARRRTEGVFSTPMAITALSSEALKVQGIDSVSDLDHSVPNLNITRFGVGNPSHAAIFIRGIGIQDHIITTDPGVALYVDGVYLGRQMGANLDLANVERVEVLRGPQGTLYGRNSIGGAVNIITRKPGDEEGFEFDLQAGTRERVAGSFYGNFALADNLDMSVSGRVTRRDGIGRALRIVERVRKVGEILEVSGRVAVRWQAADNFELLWTADGVQGEYGQSPSTAEIIPGLDQPGVFAATGNGFFTDPIGPATGLPGGPLKASDIAADPDDTNTSVAILLAQSNASYGSSLTGTLDIDEHLSLKTLGSYRHEDYRGGLDDETAFQDFQSFPERGQANQVSLEAQLNGEYGNLDFVGGVYYFNEDGFTFSGVNTFITHGDTFDINQTTNSYAGYFHAGFRFTDRLKLGGGIRWTHDKKRADALFTNFPWFLPPPVGNGNGTPGSAQREFRVNSWSRVTWDTSLTYDLSDNVHLYYTDSKGYQNGGYPARPFGGPSQFTAFDPTTARNHEFGIKGRPTDFWQTAISLFLTNYNNLPLQFSAPSEAGFVTITENAGKSRSKGFEFESTLVAGPFSLQTSIGYLDAQIRKVKPGTIGTKVGDRPTLSPRWTLSVGPQFRNELANGDVVTVRVDYSYRSAMFGQSINNAFNRIAGRDLTNFLVSYENVQNGWTLAAYGENIFNEKYDVGRLDQFFSGFTEVILNNDRSEFGIKFSKRFGGL